MVNPPDMFEALSENPPTSQTRPFVRRAWMGFTDLGRAQNGPSASLSFWASPPPLQKKQVGRAAYENTGRFRRVVSSSNKDFPGNPIWLPFCCALKKHNFAKKHRQKKTVWDLTSWKG